MAASTLWQIIFDQAQQSPESPALLAPGRTPLSYGLLWNLIEGTNRQLNALGLGRGDCVALVMPDGPEMAAAFLAISSTAACAPLNPSYRINEFDYYLKDLKARAVVTLAGDNNPAVNAARQGGLPLIELCPQTEKPAGFFTLKGKPQPRTVTGGLSQPDDISLLLHTSGTTSHPKLVPLTQRNLHTSADNIRQCLQLSPPDRCLNIMPLFHIHGLMAAVSASLAGGASVVCTPGFLPTQFFHWLEEFSPTWYTAVPTMHQSILAQAGKHRHNVQSAHLRFVRSSSASLPPQVMAELEQLFNCPAIESYGMTEATHQVASNPLPPLTRKPGSVGMAAGSKVAIMAEDSAARHSRRVGLAPGKLGEIVIWGASIMDGYLDNPQANASAFSNGWFRTGDQGYLDAEGYLFITGRLKELINRGGEKISPREVDEVLLGHPAVAQAVTFAMPDATLGEEVAAAVVLRTTGVSEKELRQFVAERLADFKVPRRIVFVEEIPKGPTGKIQRIGLAEKLGLVVNTPPRGTETAAIIAPHTPMEIQLAEIWCEVLELEEVGANQSFLELGGNSLLVTQLLTRIQVRLGAAPRFLDFFDAPTIAEQAQLMEETLAKAGSPSATPTELRRRRKIRNT